MKIVSLHSLPEIVSSHNVGKKKQFIGNNEIPSLVQFSQVSFDQGEVVAEHKHEDMYEIYLVEQGAGMIKINGENHPLAKGTCLVIDPGELHEVSNTGDGNLVLTYFGIMAK